MQFLIHIGTSDPTVSTHSRIQINSHQLLSINSITLSRKNTTGDRLKVACEEQLVSLHRLSLNDLHCVIPVLTTPAVTVEKFGAQ